MIMNYRSLEKILGYQFHNVELLQHALTHRSHNANHNERLEFLGDALLETIISVRLYHDRPELPEGDLTRLRAAVVKGTQLAALAQKCGIGKYLRLGPGELKSGGARRDSILANVIEAIIAAVYLDSDFATCEAFTLALFAEALENLPDPQQLKDAKTQLQEYLQGMGLPLPHYEIAAEHGPEHAREFEIQLQSEKYFVSARGSSRKKAEQQAAEAMLNLYRKSL